MTLLRRAWIQVESKYFSYPTDTQTKEILTIIQSDAAINSWLATSNGNKSIPLILPHVLSQSLLFHLLSIYSKSYCFLHTSVLLTPFTLGRQLSLTLQKKS